MIVRKLFFLNTLILLSISSYTWVECARILGVFSFPGKSHFMLGNSLMKGLAEAGHDVTVISSHEDKVPPTNGSYRNILLTGFVDEHQKSLKYANFFGKESQSISAVFSMLEMIHSQIDRSFNITKQLLNSGEKFDVIIVEQFFNEAEKVYAHNFDAPLIIFSSIGASDWVNNIVGNPSPLSFIPHVFSNLPEDMNFFQKIQNILLYLSDQALKYFYIFPRSEAIIKKHFPNAPNFNDIYHNVSLVLLNSHESFSQPVPLVPTMVQIGGYHVQPPKKLPKDLQEYLDQATDGVIYFSMGSNLKSKDLPAEKREAFLKAFSKLKQKVLWKWEDDVLPGQPPNVKLAKWLPQQDILDHPNVKVFITHGGLLSCIETIYYGVPILAIPVFGDQHTNAMTAVRDGYGLSLPYYDPSFSEEKLSPLLDELLHNSKYTENVKYRSKIFHDRPVKPMQKAIYWVEYIIRHKKTTHLRVGGVGMPLYQYYLLDVFAFLFSVTALILFVLYMLLKWFIRRRISLKGVKEKKH